MSPYDIETKLTRQLLKKDLAAHCERLCKEVELMQDRCKWMNNAIGLLAQTIGQIKD